MDLERSPYRKSGPKQRRLAREPLQHCVPTLCSVAITQRVCGARRSTSALLLNRAQSRDCLARGRHPRRAVVGAATNRPLRHDRRATVGADRTPGLGCSEPSESKRLSGEGPPRQSLQAEQAVKADQLVTDRQLKWTRASHGAGQCAHCDALWLVGSAAYCAWRRAGVRSSQSTSRSGRCRPPAHHTGSCRGRRRSRAGSSRVSLARRSAAASARSVSFNGSPDAVKGTRRSD